MMDSVSLTDHRDLIDKVCVWMYIRMTWRHTNKTGPTTVNTGSGPEWLDSISWWLMPQAGPQALMTMTYDCSQTTRQASCWMGQLCSPGQLRTPDFLAY